MAKLSALREARCVGYGHVYMMKSVLAELSPSSTHWSDGLAVFRHFLRSEFSEENLDFWLAVERFKKTRPVSKMAVRAAKIYDEFICTSAGRQVLVCLSLSVCLSSSVFNHAMLLLCLQVNVDSSVRESTNQSLRLGISPASFQLAQDQIFSLMETDSYPRFLRSHLYSQLANQGAEMATKSSN